MDTAYPPIQAGLGALREFRMSDSRTHGATLPPCVDFVFRLHAVTVDASVLGDSTQTTMG